MNIIGTLQIGTIIATNRKKKLITQEELAKHLGVSKPAVSKWESGQSYPDIMLLPILAAYFNISVDDLIGYEPQMTKEEINKLYHKLAEAFSREPFEKVYSECEAYVKKYYSCWQLQIQIGLILINHASLVGKPERIREIIEAALEMFKRVEKSSEDVSLAKQALILQSFCYLSLEQPIEAIDLLEEMDETYIRPEMLLIKAYQMKGDMEKALEYLQGYVYASLMSIFGAAPDFFHIYATDQVKMEKMFKIYISLSEVFELEKLQPAALLELHLAAGMVFIEQDQKEKAMDSLEYCVELMYKSNKGNFVLKGNDIFNLLESYLKEVNIDTLAPRDAVTIWNDFINLFRTNPVFDPLRGDERYKRLMHRLENE